MDSDRLGRFGERLFPVQCGPTLHCNKSEEDRTGWDYYVEWPNDRAAGVAFDRRPVPLSCMVQVKAKKPGGDIITAPLAAMERLAKDPKPSFLYVMHIADNGDLVSAYAISLRGQFLEKVLLALRQAFANDQSLQDKLFRFSIKRWGISLDAKPGSFRDYVEAEVGSDLAAFMAAKKEEISTIGYAEIHSTIRGSFHWPDKASMIQSLLGNCDFDMTIDTTVDHRFGIPVVDATMTGAGSGRITLCKDNECSLAFYRDRLSEPMIFPAKYTSLPEGFSSRGSKDIVVDAGTFQILLSAIEIDDKVEVSLNMTFEHPSPQDPTRTVAEWTRFYELLVETSKGSLKLALKRENLPTLTGTLDFDGPQDTSNWLRILKVLKALESLLRIAGAKNAPFQLHDAIQSARDIISVQAMIGSEDAKANLNFTTLPIDPSLDGSVFDILYFSIIPLPPMAILFCVKSSVKASVADDAVHWSSFASELKHLTTIPMPQNGNLEGEAFRWVQNIREEEMVESYCMGNFSGPEIQRQSA